MLSIHVPITISNIVMAKEVGVHGIYPQEFYQERKSSIRFTER